MKRTQKNLFTSLTLLSLLLLTTGCAPKNPDGSYNARYSYDQYNSHQQVNRQERFNTPNEHSNSIGNNIEHVAKSLLGTDYQYGANGPYQYDCSSFTKYVFSKQGITLPRVSRDQAKIGQFIPARKLQKGDLVFFSSKRTSGVAHVGIYLGRGKFIHASSAKDQVTISNLNANYYSKHFKWGRRVTNLSYARR